MADVQKKEIRFYVGRINRRAGTVEIISFDEWNGLFGTYSTPSPQYSFPEARQANLVISALNEIYDARGVHEFRCYLMRNVENSTHVVGDIDQSYLDVFNRYFNIGEDEEETPEETTPEEPTE